MRICLIHPPRIAPKCWGTPSVFQPLDIAYVAACLEKEHDVHLIDAASEGWKNLEEISTTQYRQGLKNEEIARRIRQFSPDIVGITVPFSGWWRSALEVASTTKDVFKDIPTVVMGLHPSTRPLDCLAYSNVNFAVIGEAEQTMYELVNALEKEKSSVLKKIRGIAYIEKGNIVVTEPRPPICGLDSLPFPARHLLQMKSYFEAVKEYPLRGEINKPWASVITSRGCPHNCIFCSAHVVNGKTWRGRSPINVVDELDLLVKTYHIKQVDFLDDNMTLDPKRMAAICDLIVKRGLDIEWFASNGVRADTLNKSLLIKMKASGCKKIRVAPESGVQRVVNEVIGKNQRLEDVEKAVVFCKKIDIQVGCFFVIGLIGETKEDIKESINYARKLRTLGATSFIFSIAQPQYGTELYKQAKSGGFLRKIFSDEALSTTEPLIETPEFTADELKDFCVMANLVNPTFTLAKLAKAIKNPEKAIKFLVKK